MKKICRSLFLGLALVSSAKASSLDDLLILQRNGTVISIESNEDEIIYKICKTAVVFGLSRGCTAEVNLIISKKYFLESASKLDAYKPVVEQTKVVEDLEERVEVANRSNDIGQQLFSEEKIEFEKILNNPEKVLYFEKLYGPNWRKNLVAQMDKHRESHLSEAKRIDLDNISLKENLRVAKEKLSILKQEPKYLKIKELVEAVISNDDYELTINNHLNNSEEDYSVLTTIARDALFSLNAKVTLGEERATNSWIEDFIQPIKSSFRRKASVFKSARVKLSDKCELVYKDELYSFVLEGSGLALLSGEKGLPKRVSYSSINPERFDYKEENNNNMDIVENYYSKDINEVFNLLSDDFILTYCFSYDEFFFDSIEKGDFLLREVDNQMREEELPEGYNKIKKIEAREK